MPKYASPTVKIISHTQEALELLIYTKSNRLKAGTTLDDIRGWGTVKKLDHLEYMFNTIQSAFEFVNYVIEIKNVSRAFTHQLVRTRTNAYQQESQRTVDVRDNSVHLPSYDGRLAQAIDFTFEAYQTAIDAGMPVQDARTVLPTGVHTNILMRTDLRTLSHMAEARLCYRTQGEYQDVFKQIRAAVLSLHPWAEPLLQVYCVKTGLCMFPNYNECPIQKHTLNELAAEAKPTIRYYWETTLHEAEPVAKNGKTM